MEGKSLQNDWWTVKRKKIKNEIFQKLKQNSLMETTDIKKIVINSGVKQVTINEQYLLDTQKILTKISQGQKAVTTLARKSIIGFKIREGMKIGCMVTLRKKRAWDFLFELININLPLINNFQGLSLKKFDKNGNYNFGINDLNVFPVVPFDLTFKNQGIQINFVFFSNSLTENKLFLQLLGFPFSAK